MNDQVKNEQDSAAVDGAAGSADTPAVVENGTNDQSAANASDAVSASVPAGTPTAEPANDEPPFELTQPPAPTSELSATSTDADIAAHALYDTWREATGMTIGNAELRDFVNRRVAELLGAHTTTVQNLARQKKVADEQAAAKALQDAADARAAENAAKAAAQKPVVQEPTGNLASPSAALAGPTKYDEVNRLLAGVPKGKLGIIHFLVEYSRDLAPRKPIVDKDGAHMQAQLYTQLTNLINKEDEHFKELFSAVLRFVEMEIKGAFSQIHAFRWMDHVPLNADQREGFCNLMHLLRLTGPVASRKVNIKSVSLQKSLSKGITDAGRARVLSFYND